MCIMEVREGQHHSTITQAEAHNVNTVIGDLDMFASRLDTGGNKAKAQRIREIRDRLVTEYRDLMDLYCGFLATEVTAAAPGAPEPQVTEIVERIVARDARRAHVYETR